MHGRHSCSHISEGKTKPYNTSEHETHAPLPFYVISLVLGSPYNRVTPEFVGPRLSAHFGLYSALLPSTHTIVLGGLCNACACTTFPSPS